MTNKELQEAINQAFYQLKDTTSVDSYEVKRHLEELRKIQLERAKEE